MHIAHIHLDSLILSRSSHHSFAKKKIILLFRKKKRNNPNGLHSNKKNAEFIDENEQQIFFRFVEINVPAYSYSRHYYTPFGTQLACAVSLAVNSLMHAFTIQIGRIK